MGYINPLLELPEPVYEAGGATEGRVLSVLAAKKPEAGR